jgi:hypothetical protein
MRRQDPESNAMPGLEKAADVVFHRGASTGPAVFIAIGASTSAIVDFWLAGCYLAPITGRPNYLEQLKIDFCPHANRQRILQGEILT